MFSSSQTKPLTVQPWRWTTQPNPDGSGGVKETLNGVFILLDDSLIDELALLLNTAESAQLRAMIHRVTAAEAGEWHMPLWAGQTSAAYIRVPATLWSNPAAPPAKIKRFFGRLYRDGA